FKFKTERESYVTPTRQLSLDEYPLFHDDLNFNGMKLAIERQLTRFAEKNLSGTIQMGQRRYPLTAMKKSLEVFRQLIWEFESCSYKKISESCYQTFNQAVRSRFDIFIPDLTPDDPRYGEDKTTFFTGYHTMPVEGSARRRGPYQYPIYANPGDSRLYF